MVIDVGYQGVVDYPLLAQEQITGGQYAGRLGVAAGGSVLSWLVGLGAGGIAVSASAPAIVVGGTIFVVGVSANIAYDMILAPRLRDWFGLSTEEERKRREY